MTRTQPEFRGDFPAADRDITETPAWDGTAWGGASDIGLPDGAVYGPPPAAPTVTP